MIYANMQFINIKELVLRFHATIQFKKIVMKWLFFFKSFELASLLMKNTKILKTMVGPSYGRDQYSKLIEIV